jgi:hypothetical protein
LAAVDEVGPDKAPVKGRRPLQKQQKKLSYCPADPLKPYIGKVVEREKVEKFSKSRRLLGLGFGGDLNGLVRRVVRQPTVKKPHKSKKWQSPF